MFKTKEVSRSWEVKRVLLPDLTNFKYVDQSIIFLSGVNDSLQTSINEEIHSDGTVYHYISVIDISGNKLSYIVPKEDFDETKEIFGKSLNKKVYLIPSEKNTDQTLQLSIFKKLDIMTANYYLSDVNVLNTLESEMWFGDELVDSLHTDIELFNKVI